MINWQERATQLVEQWHTCAGARPRGDNAAEVQMEKDSCMIWVHHLNTVKAWGSDVEIAEACNQLSSRLSSLEEKVIIEILKHGAV